tara:strand:+ start:3328 stop:3486 length:159 start_codon:yes stop_codon:yes gene_type:complete
MENLSDFITTKYNIILFDLKQQKIKSAKAGAIGASNSSGDNTNNGTSNEPYN